MEITTDEVLQRLRSIKEEAEVIESRVKSTREHVEQAEKEMENIKHVIFKGFHTATEKINQMDGDIHKLADKLDIVLKHIEHLEELEEKKK